MSHYDDVVMPITMRFGSSTQQRTSSQVLYTASGFRKANQRWEQKLRKLKLTYRLKDTDFVAIRKISEAMEGPVHSFLARDWSDWNTSNGDMARPTPTLTAVDQVLKNTVTGLFVGDGSTLTYQMVKTYPVGSTATHTRTIQKPQNGTILVSVNSVTMVVTTDYTVNYATGVVTFVIAPPVGQAVKWGGAYYIPVAFTDDDLFDQELSEGQLIDVSGIELMEIRL